jgi:hypothetical protein
MSAEFSMMMTAHLEMASSPSSPKRGPRKGFAGFLVAEAAFLTAE